MFKFKCPYCRSDKGIEEFIQCGGTVVAVDLSGDVPEYGETHRVEPIYDIYFRCAYCNKELLQKTGESIISLDDLKEYLEEQKED